MLGWTGVSGLLLLGVLVVGAFVQSGVVQTTYVGALLGGAIGSLVCISDRRRTGGALSRKALLLSTLLFSIPIAAVLGAVTGGESGAYESMGGSVVTSLLAGFGYWRLLKSLGYRKEVAGALVDTRSAVGEVQRQERECPWCAERILERARVCKHCGRDVQPTGQL